MQLEKIEMTGFKSFADKTVIEFDKGVTAVVGPNGSGKSNLSEAIKWVLGEQSAKTLRGKKMDDVIFAGSQTRKPVNIAEVSLHINNEDGALAIDQAQVVITRRFSRSGASDFFINKKPCRLKDVTSLMMDSGLGKDSFALISQGKVEQIFNNKPEERRMIIEEAAGVLKYKDRKTQAQRKLEQTQDHLNRVEDILHEIQGQLAPLLAQKEKAITYLAKKEELQHVETALLAVEIETLNSQWTVAKQEVAQLQEEVTRTEEAIVKLRQDLSQKQTLFAEKNAALDQKQAQYVADIQRMEQLDGERRVYEQRQAFSQQTDAETQETLTSLIHEIEQLEADLQQLSIQIATKAAERQQVDAQWEALVHELDQLSQGDEERQRALQSEYIEQLQEVSRLTNQEKHLERSMEQNRLSHDRMIDKQETLTTQQQSAQQQVESLTEQLETATQQLQESQAQLESYRDQTTTLREERAAAHEKLQKVDRQLQQTQATYRSLKQISEDYAGYYQGVREVLKQKTQLTGVVGAVAELVRVDDAYTLAIDIALGASSQHVVVRDEQAAARAIEYLKAHRLGRATFLPMTIIREKQLNASVVHQAQGFSGFVGVASDLVTTAPEFESIVKNILGTTLVTKTLKDTMQLAKALQYRYRIVSLEGDVANAGGSMTGGASKNHQQQSLVKRNSQLETLEDQLNKLRQLEHRSQEQVATYDAQWQTLVTTVQEIQEQIQLHTQKEQEYRMQLGFNEEELKKITRQLQAQQFELDEIIDQYTELEQQYIANHNDLRLLTQQSSQAKKELDVMQLSQEDRTQQLQEKQQLLQEVGTKRATLHEQEQQLLRDQKQHKQQHKRLKQQEELLHSKQDKTHELKQEQAATYQEVLAAYDTIKQQVTDLEQELATLKDERAHLEIEVTQVETNRNHAQQSLQEQLKNQAKVETKANRFELAIDQKLTYLSEEYELTFEAASARTELTLSIDEASRLVRQLKQQIEQMGVVNVMAIEEHAQVEERYEFLSAQQADLLEAKQNLEDTITEMDEEVTTRFKQTFDAISMQFQKTFPRLFGGGRASLELTDPDNLLETGLEIIAQPPGKKLQSLSLLSGGERAFTAIALLFAILEVKPVPFCLLDEVEAALDEANVARYGRYLKEFTKNTQFIVITHRRGTMEEADVLYGVTMQESGVSRLASVKFEDFDLQPS